MKILIINTGSSSIKFLLIDMPSEKRLCWGQVERLGSERSKLHYATDATNMVDYIPLDDHHAGLEKISECIFDPINGAVQSAIEIDLVAHRVVHGGHAHQDCKWITTEIKESIAEHSHLAPLHNPLNLAGIDLSEQLFPTARQVAVFDTAFHQTIPYHARQYAIPSTLALAQDIVKSGFHGISHQYVANYAIEHFGLGNANIISIHLGNGASMSAIQNGICVDNSMGFSPSTGLIMGTRSGDIDHNIIFYLVHTMQYDLHEVEDMLNNQSGLLGLTGMSDYRDVQQAANDGDTRSKLAIDMTVYRIKQYIGAYAAIMDGVDGIIFTAGIGENAPLLRSAVCRNMNYLNLELDEQKNTHTIDKPTIISTDQSDVKVMVIHTNESLEMAREAWSLVSD